MKTKMLSLILVLVCVNAWANDSRYVETMTRSIEDIYKAKTSEELVQATNAFSRIGQTEKDKWEPFYYESFGYIMLANREPNASKKDAYLDQAKTALDKAASIKANESEIVALDGFISMIRVTVDPASRGQKYSGLAMQTFGKAIALNPENPRALSLMAQMQLGTARFFNAPPTEACATANKALEKFASFVAAGPLSPVWGKGMTEEMVKNCK